MEKRRRKSSVGDLREQQVMDFIREYRRAHSISPSGQEISVHLFGHERNAGNISKVIQRLIDSGKLTKAVKGARSLIPSDELEGA